MCFRLYAVTGKSKIQTGILLALAVANSIAGLWFTVVTSTHPRKFINHSFFHVRN